MKTPAELINSTLRRELRAKQNQLVAETANALDENEAVRRAARAAIRRIQKSIALRTSRLLCEHVVKTRTLSRYGKSYKAHSCVVCKFTAIE